MNPTRRTLLKFAALATATGLAGCIGEDPQSDSPGPGAANGTGSPTPTPTPTASPTDDGLPGAGGNGSNGSGETRPRGTGGPGVFVAGTDDVTGPIEHRVEVLREAATDDAPPQVRVSVTNTTDSTLHVGEGRAVVFAYREDTDGHLVLLPADGEYPAEAGCWRLTEPIAVTEEYRITRLAPGQTVEQSLDLYATPGEDACLPVGEFRFETTYEAMRGETTPEAKSGTSGTWGFTVLLE
ncbi:hypothetical protein [Halomarina litorea]|uniref:hypothetical protein n=1 Tax=Halomarina litorea TaxID=2961595 RepID=UPI0020C44B02|nr:hypothetical protein [Halomarina sp. BCD28]